MKVNDIVINENTTSGSVATVATSMPTQKRSAVGKGVYSDEKPGNLLTGKKKYANSVSESKMKQVAVDLENMQDGNFLQKYKKTKQQMMRLLGTPASLQPKNRLEVNESVPLRFDQVNLSKDQLSSYSIDLFEEYNINKHNQNYKSLLLHMHQNSKRLVEATELSGIEHFVNTIDRLSSKKEIKIGDMFSVLSFIINPVWEHVEVIGFTKPKKVKEIKLNQDGSINYIIFDDLERYPRVPIAAVGKHPAQCPAYFNSEQEADHAVMVLKLVLPESWEMDMDSVNTPNNRSGLKENSMRIEELSEEDKLIDPKKGRKRKTGLHGKDEEERLSQYRAPFKSSGDFVSDSRGNKVCECDNEDLAKEVAKAINAYVKKDESVGATTAGVIAGTLKNAPTGYHFDPKGYCRLGDK